MEYKESTDPIMIELQGDPIDSEPGEFGEPKRIHLRIDVPVMRRLRRYEEPIDIRKLIDPSDKEFGGLYGRMRADPGIVIDIAYEATRSDPKSPKTPEAFAEGLFGDSLDKITEAVIEAVVRFTPDRTNRKAYRLILNTAENAAEEAQEEAIKKLESDEMKQIARDAIADLDKTQMQSIDESLNSAVSSDSTQTDRTPSEN